MTTRISSPNATTQAIERRIIQAGADGTTYNVIMGEMKLGRTCVRNHLNMLVDLGRVYSVRRTQPGRTAIYYTYHAKGAQATPLLSKDDHFNLKAGVVPRRHTLRTWAPINRRDELVAYLFGPAPAQRAV
jgi:predicted ArsR family transcriptional regulator